MMLVQCVQAIQKKMEVETFESFVKEGGVLLTLDIYE